MPHRAGGQVERLVGVALRLEPAIARPAVGRDRRRPGAGSGQEPAQAPGRAQARQAVASGLAATALDRARDLDPAPGAVARLARPQPSEIGLIGLDPHRHPSKPNLILVDSWLALLDLPSAIVSRMRRDPLDRPVVWWGSKPLGLRPPQGHHLLERHDQLRHRWRRRVLGHQRRRRGHLDYIPPPAGTSLRSFESLLCRIVVGASKAGRCLLRATSARARYPMRHPAFQEAASDNACVLI